MKTFILFITIFISLNSLKGQKPYNNGFTDPLLDKYRWRHCKELSGKNFYCFCEQNDGTMWFGIENGIISYDGYKWTEYLIPKEKMGIGQIRTMVFSGDTLFVGGDNGIQTFLDEKWLDLKFSIKETQRYTDMYAKGEFLVWDLKVSNGIILGASFNGLYVRKNGQDHYYTNQEFIQRRDTVLKNLKFHSFAPFGKSIRCFFSNILDCGNNAYYGFLSFSTTKKNYFKFKLTDDNNNPLELVDDNVKDDIAIGGPVASVIRANGEVWVVSEDYNKGLNILRNNKWEYFSFKENLNDSEVSCSILDLEDGSILITSLGLIYRYYNNQWSKIIAPDMPFKSKYLYSKYTQSGDLWLGDYKGEVYKIDYSPKHWSNYSHLNYQFTNRDSSLWFISDDEKVVFKKENNWYYFDQSDGLPLFPQTLYLSKNGTIWCGGSHNKVSATAYLKNNKWILYRHDSLSWGINYNAVTEDRNGDIWFGGASNPQAGQKGGGVKIHQGIDKVEIAQFYKTKKPYLYSFVFGDDNTLYAGTDVGLFTWKNNQLKSIGLDNHACNRLMQTSEGSIWVATIGKGIVKLDGSKVTALTAQQGLTSNVIYDLFAVNDSSIWAATNEGFSYYNGRYWINNIFPSELNLDTESGKLSGEANSIWISKFPLHWTRRAYDNLKFKGTKVDFFSVMYKRDKMAPETEITMYFNKVASTGNTNIEWSGNDYMEHTTNGDLLYSFRVNSNEWSIPNSKSNINLTNLSPGDYVFEVKAFDKDMNEDPSPAKVQFIVAPPVWQEAWFIIMVVSFVSTIIFLNIRIIRRNNKLALLNINLEKSQSELLMRNEELRVSEEEIRQSNEVLYSLNEQLISQKEELETTVAKLKETQTQLIQSEKMASLGVLSAGVAHEINNPLNFIQGGAMALESYFSEHFQNKLGEIEPMLKGIQVGVKRATSIVTSLSHYSRQDSLSYTKCDINSIIENCLVMLQNETKHRIEIEKLYTSKPYQLLGNEGKLHQIMLNILANAIQAIEKNGTIIITTAIEHERLKVLISDNGCGISAENLSKIMDPFFTTKDPGKGTGLGLSIVYNIIKEHNGNISFESELTKGTTVTIKLPLNN